MQDSSNKPLIVIFGRTNVGKSTLFNALSEKRQALISDTPGTTRDSNIAEVSWRGRDFALVDTGGFMNLDFLSKRKIKAETIDEKVQKQARDYIKRADVILFVVDAKDGLLPQDKTMASILKRIIPSTKHVLLIANKVDTLRKRNETSDFYNLGLGEVYSISASTGTGTGDMLDAILNIMNLPLDLPRQEIADYEEEEESNEEKEDKKDDAKTAARNDDKSLEDLSFIPANDADRVIKVCLLGKPNVGKSSLLNAILGYSRVIVSEIPHTTREPQSTPFVYKQRPLLLVDTAGISRHGHKTHTLEKFSMDKSLATLHKSDIAVLIIDINEGLTKQDSRLVEEIKEKHKSLIIVANKWDLPDEHDMKKYTNYVYGELPFARYAPLQFLSAKNRSKIDHLLDLILEVDAQRRQTISDTQAERLMKAAVKKHRPTKGRGTKYPSVYEFKQTGVNPPQFLIRIGANESIADTYLRYMENQLRSKFGFLGTPISMWVQKGRSVHGAHSEPGSKEWKD